MLVRTAIAQDIAAIQPIYAHHVLNGLASFEEEAPPVDEMCRRFEEVTARGLPYLVAEEKSEVLGYGYCTLYRTRSAYRHTLEDSIYVKQGRHGKGIGKAVLAELIARCTDLNYRQIIAVIGDSANAGSIGVHRRLGFEHVGVMKSAGWKFDRWLDVVVMQRALGLGDSQPPGAGE